MSTSDRDQTPFAVKVVDLVKTYRSGVEANRGISFTAKRGEIVAIVGPNGAGKTTFLRQLTTELEPTSGSITIFDIDAVREPQKAKLVMGVAPQESGFFDTLTAAQHLELFGRLKGLTRSESRRQTNELLTQLDLDDKRGRRVRELSGGQQRRILIGLAMIGKPPL